jgi:hypothetical protein
MYGSALYLRILSTKRDVGYFYVVWNVEVAPRFLDNLCTAGLLYI